MIKKSIHFNLRLIFFILSLLLSSHILATPLPKSLQLPETETGYLKDAPISGIFYQTTSGIKNKTQKGKYNYQLGDQISFYLGRGKSSIHLGTFKAKEQLFAKDMTLKSANKTDLTKLLHSLSVYKEPQKGLSTDVALVIDMDRVRRLDLSTLIIDQIDLEGYKDLSNKYSLDSGNLTSENIELQNHYQYIKSELPSQQIIYQPLKQKIHHVSIKLRDAHNNLCFYDLDKAETDNDFGPLRRKILKFDLGVFEYPVTEKSNKNSTTCEMNDRALYKNGKFTSMLKLRGKTGLHACIFKGCTSADLNGYVIEERDSNNGYLYNVNTMHFITETEVLFTKQQGLGAHKKIASANKAEILFFDYVIDHIPTISMDGQWQQKQIAPNNITYRCLKISNNEIWATPSSSNNCKTAKQKQILATHEYPDMWWLKHPINDLYFYHLNIPVTWKDKQGTQQYTTWEYLPVSHSLNDGIIYRYQQSVDQATQTAYSNIIDEFTRIQE